MRSLCCWLRIRLEALSSTHHALGVLVVVATALAGCATLPPNRGTSPGNTAPYGPGSLWVSMRDGFALDHDTSQPSVRAWIRFYQAHQAELHEDLVRAGPFLWRIVHTARQRHLPVELALLPEVESAYNPFARSDVSGATGLWQFMPATAQRFGLRQDWWYDGRRGLFHSTSAALTYLQSLHRTFHGDWLLALAAYNAGEETVSWAVERNARRGLPTDFWHLDLPAQTEQYVPRLLALAALVSQPRWYGISLPSIPDGPQLKPVTIPGPIDLRLAARLAGIPIRTLRELNPGYRRWASAPDQPTRLLLPRRRIAAFERRLASIPPARRVTWRRHVVQPGDTLELIAREYGISVPVLREINHLSTNRIRPGASLRIPKAQDGEEGIPVSVICERDAVRAHPLSIVTRYAVRAGDSLWGIAHRKGVRLALLRRWNQLGPHSVLQPGETLIIRHDPFGAPPSRRAPPVREQGRGPARFTVRRGDNLWEVARRFGVSVGKLRRWNRLRDGTVIKPGQVLRIPRAGGQLVYHVHKGDSLAAIARRYRVSVSDIRRWNGLARGRYLYPGQRLEIVLGAGASPHKSRT